MENIQELKTILSIPKDIVITTHRNPDGDAIGSSLALYHYLNKHGHTVRIVSPSEYPDFLGWLPDAEKIVIYDIDSEHSASLIGKADVIFCLDFNSLDRIDKVGELIAPTKAKKVMIDHHLYPENFADFMLSDTKASSTCELIYDFIELLEDKKNLDKDISECIFTGILTDTGSFKYGTSGKLFNIVGDLLERGVEDHEIQDRVFNCLKEKHLRLLGHCLNHRMEILEEYKTGIITLTKDDYARFEIQRGDTEGIVNYLLKIKDIKVAAFITEQPNIVKLSLRSKHDVDVQSLARNNFNGGGHKNASGGYTYEPLDKAIRRLKKVIPDYIRTRNEVL